MTTRSRVARALIPRFGILWMAAAMLLVVSGAGWWTFHRDLYVEEQAVIEQLKRSGAKIAVHRIDYPSFVGSAEEADTSIPWNAPLLEPILMISAQENPAPEARVAILRLPRLKSYSEDPPLGKPSRDGWQQVERRLGAPLPELPEATLEFAALYELLPEGTPVDDAEATRIATAIREAWRNPGAIPPRRLVVSETTGKADPYEAVSEAIRVDAIEPGRGFRWSSDERPGWGASAAILRGDEISWFRRIDREWKRTSRRLDYREPVAEALHRRFPNDEFPYGATDFWGDGTVWARLRESDEPYRFDRIARVDDVRYRVDFSPFEVPDARYDLHWKPPQIAEWRCVLRSDLDWVPESSRMVQMLTQGLAPATRHERRTEQRFRRVGAYVTLVERVAGERQGTGLMTARFNESRALYATEIDFEVDASVFDPLALDPEPWPERRELPWLRWYRVTFALGSGIMLFLVGRRVANWSRGGDGETTDETKSESLPEEREELPASEPA